MTEHELILTNILNCRRIDIHTRFPSLTSEQEFHLDDMRRRRSLGEPLQYILGECEFMGLPFKVDRRVLIPRPETEILVDAVIEQAKKKFSSKNQLRILDIGTGSGNIAVSLAKFLPNALITTLDISEEAIVLAKENARLNGVEERINFCHEDMQFFFRRCILAQCHCEEPAFSDEAISEDCFAPKPGARNDTKKQNYKFDIIVSNPPYIKRHDIARLPRDVQQEPHSALDGGMDGMEYFRIIIDGIVGADMLRSGGLLFLEIGDGQAEGIRKIFRRQTMYSDLEFQKDYVNVDRIARAIYRDFRIAPNLINL